MIESSLDDHKSTIKGKDNLKNVVSENEQIYSMLVSTITQAVYEKLEEKESRSRNIFIGIASLIIALVVTVSGFLVNEMLTIRIEKKVSELQGNSLKEALFIVDVAALDIDARSLRDADSYSKEEANSIIRKIERLYKNGILNNADQKQVNQNIDRLLFAFDSAILSFAVSNRVDYILELEKKVPLVAQASTDSAMVITLTLGNVLLQDPFAPESWGGGDGQLSPEYDKYLFYSKKIKNSGYPEFYLLYNMLFKFIQKTDETKIKGLIADLDDLTPIDKGNFTSRLKDMLNLTDTAGEKRVSVIVKSFIEQYGDENAVFDELIEIIANQ